MNIVLQVLTIGSNVWLNIWSNDNSTSTLVNGTVNEYKRNMYLGVYGCFGLGQGIINIVTNSYFKTVFLKYVRNEK